jgi:hypothetical protein
MTSGSTLKPDNKKPPPTSRERVGGGFGNAIAVVEYGNNGNHNTVDKAGKYTGELIAIGRRLQEQGVVPIKQILELGVGDYLPPPPTKRDCRWTGRVLAVIDKLPSFNTVEYRCLDDQDWVNARQMTATQITKYLRRETCSLLRTAIFSYALKDKLNVARRAMDK